MKKYDIKQYIFIILMILVLFFNIFVLNIASKFHVLLFVISAFFISLSLYQIKRDSFPYRKQATVVVGIFAILQVAFFYILGIKTGYKENLIRLTGTSLIKIIIPLVFIIIFSELLRYILVRSKDKSKMYYWSIILIFVLLDISLFGQSYNLSTLQDFLEFVGLILFPSIFSNILFTETSLKFGYRPTIIYRLITNLYGYFIPVIPDVYVFFRSILRMLVPYIVYVVMGYMFDRKAFEKAVAKKTTVNIITMVIFIMVILLAMLISCRFKYGAMTIGSNSMKDAISKGDIIIFEKYENQDINIGDILLFNSKGTAILHRVVEIGILNNKYVYVTKGDNNKVVDNEHLYEENIIGIYKSRIKYIGYPTLWISDMFK